MAIWMLAVGSLFVMPQKTLGQSEDERVRNALHYLQHRYEIGRKLAKSWAQIWGGEREKQRREKYKTPEAFARRPLDQDEKELIAEMLAFVKDKKIDWGDRNIVLDLLKQVGHVSMIDPLASIIWDKSKLKEQKEAEKKFGWGYHPETEVMEEAVMTLGSIADERSVDELLKILDHPLEEVKTIAVHVLGLLRGNSYAIYAVNSWFQTRDEKGEEAAKTMWREWWAKNRGKVKLNWELVRKGLGVAF